MMPIVNVDKGGNSGRGVFKFSIKSFYRSQGKKIEKN